MKAHEAPDKIYLKPLLTEEGDSIVRRCTFERQSDSQIEYVRPDAFIGKACEKLEKCMYDNLMFQGRLHRKEVIETFIEGFKNYLKGE